MTKLTIWGWDKKPRTMLRFIKLGDIFAFRYSEAEYGFGQVIGKTSVGHVVQLFRLFKNEPLLDLAEFENRTYLYRPFILDAYSLIDRKKEGEWRIIGRQENFDQTPFADVAFKWGVPSGNIFGKTDINGNILGRDFTREEVKDIIFESPNGDDDVKWLIERELEK